MIDVRYFEVRIKTTNLRLFNLKNPYFVAIFYARFVMFGLEKKHISNGHLPSSHSVSFFGLLTMLLLFFSLHEY